MVTVCCGVEANNLSTIFSPSASASGSQSTVYLRISTEAKNDTRISSSTLSMPMRTNFHARFSLNLADDIFFTSARVLRRTGPCTATGAMVAGRSW